jgi:hypothetical protein
MPRDMAGAARALLGVELDKGVRERMSGKRYQQPFSPTKSSIRPQGC